MKIEDIKKCNDINDYLKLLNKDKIGDLTFDEIADWKNADKTCPITRYSLGIVEYVFLIISQIKRKQENSTVEECIDNDRPWKRSVFQEPTVCICSKTNA